MNSTIKVYNYLYRIIKLIIKLNFNVIYNKNKLIIYIVILTKIVINLHGNVLQIDKLIQSKLVKTVLKN